MTTEEFLIKISEGLKNSLTEKDVFEREIKISNLKRIDKLFNKGIEFYLNPKPINESEEASIFFRKDKFNSDLNIGAKKIVTKFEDLKILLSAMSKLVDVRIKRLIPIYKLTDNPIDIAKEIREKLYPKEMNPNLRDFLKQLITNFADYNIFVFEFIETWNKKDTANINGFFLTPNVIVLKRQQKSFRREIFTLIHELGHYLLNEEEIEEVEVSSLSRTDLSKIENWCNNFAYYFLIGDYKEMVDNIENASVSNDYNFDLIQHISRGTHLSILALFTRLLYAGKISRENYQNVKDQLDHRYQQKIKEEEKQKELDKLVGVKRGGSVPKPINSPLFVHTLQVALYGGIINEYDFCKQLNIKPDKIQEYL